MKFNLVKWKQVPILQGFFILNNSKKELKRVAL